ncbi:hypothetical protein ES703_32538 [subsurface metagenome]
MFYVVNKLLFTHLEVVSQLINNDTSWHSTLDNSHGLLAHHKHCGLCHGKGFRELTLYQNRC